MAKCPIPGHVVSNANFPTYRIYNQHPTHKRKKQLGCRHTVKISSGQCSSGIDYNAMATAQSQDAEIQAYRDVTSSLKLQDVPFEGSTILVIRPQAMPGLSFPPVGDARFLTWYMAYPIHPYAPRGSSFPQNSCGKDYRSKWGCGPSSASHAKLPKFKGMSRPHWRTLASRNDVSTTFT